MDSSITVKERADITQMLESGMFVHTKAGLEQAMGRGWIPQILRQWGETTPFTPITDGVSLLVNTVVTDNFGPFYEMTIADTQLLSLTDEIQSSSVLRAQIVNLFSCTG